jgi:hypothetical protein
VPAPPEPDPLEDELGVGELGAAGCCEGLPWGGADVCGGAVGAVLEGCSPAPLCELPPPAAGEAPEERDGLAARGEGDAEDDCGEPAPGVVTPFSPIEPVVPLGWP